MTDEEKKAIEFVKFYKQYCLNKELANIENYETVNDEEFVYKNLEIVLNLIEKQEKIINEMLDFFAKNDWIDCPYETFDTNLDCDNRCDDGIERECWKMYFTKKVGE